MDGDKQDLKEEYDDSVWGYMRYFGTDLMLGTLVICLILAFLGWFL